MTAEAADYSPVRLSLGGVSRRDRVALYREVIGPHVVGLDIEPVPGAPFFADLTLRRLPGLEVVAGLAGASVNRRTTGLLADGNDGFGLAIVMAGSWRVSSRGRELDESGGHAYLMSFADPSLAMTPATSSIVALQASRAALTPLIDNIDDATMRPIPRDCAPLRLLRGYLGVLEEEAALATPELRQAVVTHIHDLIALTVGATREAAATARGRGLAAARLQAMKDDVAANLTRHDLTVDLVAARHHMSPRNVQRLFGEAGVTFSAFVLVSRLARAHRMLTDPRLIDRSIAGIVFACGFGDISHFNRTFRRQYRASPSDVRAGAATGKTTQKRRHRT